MNASLPTPFILSGNYRADLKAAFEAGIVSRPVGISKADLEATVAAYNEQFAPKPTPQELHDAVEKAFTALAVAEEMGIDLDSEPETEPEADDEPETPTPAVVLPTDLAQALAALAAQDREYIASLEAQKANKAKGKARLTDWQRKEQLRFKNEDSMRFYKRVHTLTKTFGAKRASEMITAEGRQYHYKSCNEVTQTLERLYFASPTLRDAYDKGKIGWSFLYTRRYQPLSQVEAALPQAQD